MAVHHSINYIEFTVRDLAEAKSFLGDSFGWSFNDYGPDYVGIVTAEGECGGLVRGDANPGGSPLVVIFSEDIEATLAQVRDAGGTIVKEPFEFPGGRRFEFTDPSGNPLGVWSEN